MIVSVESRRAWQAGRSIVMREPSTLPRRMTIETVTRNGVATVVDGGRRRRFYDDGLEINGIAEISED